ncbi:hypothetical protein GF407_06615 [candidate division KSB1 bacterium]|nr:hypothetical protein [candidate division KSB1 bacterium]
MALWSLPAIALLRLGYSLADKKQWLPRGAYHRQSIRSLKGGDLDGAARYNAIALKKSQEYQAALIIRDVIAMHRDALRDKLSKEIAKEKKRIQGLMDRIGNLQIRNRRLERLMKQFKWFEHGVLFVILLLPVTALSGRPFFQHPIMVAGYFFLLLGIYIYKRLAPFDRKWIEWESEIRNNQILIRLFRQKIAVHLNRLKQMSPNVHDQIHIQD